MTTSTGAPDIGNLFDRIFKNPFKAAFDDAKGLFAGLAASAKQDVATAAQSALASVSAAEETAASALAGAQSQAIAAVNPIVQGFVAAGAAAVEADVPGISGLVGAIEPEAAGAATMLSDTVLTAAIQQLAGGLSQAAKSTAAVHLSTLAGAS